MTGSRLEKSSKCHKTWFSFSEPSVNQTLDLRSIKHFRIARFFLIEMGFLDKSNLLKIPDCCSFSVLKTLTGYRPYSHSEFHLSTETFGFQINFSKNNFCVYYFVPQCSFITVVQRTVEKQQHQRRLCVGEFQLQL